MWYNVQVGNEQCEKRQGKRCVVLARKQLFPCLFHRAKPVSEMERSGIERHCGVERATTSFSKRGWSEAESSLFVEAKIERSEIKPVCRSEDRAKRNRASLQKRR